MNPKSTPRLASSGESSKVALTSPSVETELPLSPLSRHHGLS